MALVAVQVSSSAVTSGTAGASLTGVTGGHGLVCFVLYKSVASGQTLTDSSGTTWALWRALSLTGSQIAVFRTTNAVVSGTHTVTASFTGGGGAWSILIEDDQSPYGGGPYAQKLTAPGAGNTLVPGGVLGTTGSSCYQLAIDTSNQGSGYRPSIGAFSGPQVYTNDDAGLGSWSIVVSTTTGGTNSGMAPNTSDSTGADNYAVLAMAFQPSGNQVVDAPPQMVLVKEDVGPEQRTPYPLGMFFNRSPAFQANTPLAFLSVKTPPWEFYRDTFTSVYPVVESYAQATLITPISPYAIRFQRTRRLDPPEEELRRFDHGVYFQLVRYYTAQMVGYHVEVPDFNDNPWLEWVHPPASPEAAMYPFRRLPVITPPQINVIWWGQPKPWYVDAEQDTVNRKPDVGALIPTARPIPPAVFMPNLIGLDQATAIGIIKALNLFYLTSVYQDVIYPILTPNRFNPLGPEPPPPYGTVVGQWPLPGTVVQPLFTEVTLYVSTGRSFISDVDTSSGNVPNTVIGSTQGP